MSSESNYKVFRNIDNPNLILNCSYCLKVIPPNMMPVTDLQLSEGVKISVFSAIFRIFNLDLKEDSVIGVTLTLLAQDIKLCFNCAANLLNLYTIHEQFTRLAALDSQISKLVRILQKSTPHPDSESLLAPHQGSSVKSVPNARRSQRSGPTPESPQKSTSNLRSPKQYNQNLGSSTSLKAAAAVPKTSTTSIPVATISRTRKQTLTNSEPAQPAIKKSGSVQGYWPLEVSVGYSFSDPSTTAINSESKTRKQSKMLSISTCQSAVFKQETGIENESDWDDDGGTTLDEVTANIKTEEEEHIPCGDSRFWCHQPDCMLTFQSAEQLKLHSKSHEHDVPNPKMASHIPANNEADTDTGLVDVTPKKRRVKQKRKKIVPHIPCTLCTKLFASHFCVRQHMDSVHLNLRPWSCTTCEKTFSSKGSLVAHTKRHSSEAVEAMKALCSICGMLCSSKASLSQHYETHFPDRAERRFKCDLCDKIFSRPGQLADHKRSHFNERSFACGICDKRFNSQKLVKCHLKFHSRPLKCTEPGCEKAYSSKEILKFHLVNTHHLSDEEARAKAGIVTKVKIICSRNNVSL